MNTTRATTAAWRAAFPTLFAALALTGCAEAIEEPRTAASAAAEPRRDGAIGALAVEPPPSDGVRATDAPADAADDDAEVEGGDAETVARFQPVLAPYGSWAEDPTYGVVWTPSATVVGTNFAPYVSAGRWTYDGTTYVWVSDYDWGWAPFHYGRWVWIAGHGWAWVPGRAYAGAWVAWRVGPAAYGYVGWAPLPPRRVYRGRRWVAVGVAPLEPYVFCPSSRVFERDLGRAIVGKGDVASVAAGTRPWVPASPRVEDGRVLASPRVEDGHAVASPRVADGRVASPHVGAGAGRAPGLADIGWQGEAPAPPPQRRLALQPSPVAAAAARPSTSLATGSTLPPSAAFAPRPTATQAPELTPRPTSIPDLAPRPQVTLIPRPAPAPEFGPRPGPLPDLAPRPPVTLVPRPEIAPRPVAAAPAVTYRPPAPVPFPSPAPRPILQPTPSFARSPAPSLGGTRGWSGVAMPSRSFAAPGPTFSAPPAARAIAAPRVGFQGAAPRSAPRTAPQLRGR